MTKNAAKYRAAIEGSELLKSLGPTEPASYTPGAHAYNKTHPEEVEPPFPMTDLAIMPEFSANLVPIIQSVANGTVGHGYRIVARADEEPFPFGDQLKTQDTPALRREYVSIRNWASAVNRKQSLLELAKQLVAEQARTGNAYVQIARAGNKISSLYVRPSFQIRATHSDSESHTENVPTVEMTTDGTYKVTKRMSGDFYRRYIQMSYGVLDSRYHALSDPTTYTSNYRVTNFASPSARYSIWFKEFGDTRQMSALDGHTLNPELESDQEIARNNHTASELYHFTLPENTTQEPYGLPAHIGSRVAIYGDWKQQIVNYVTLMNNNIPSCAVLVSGGQITTESAARVREYWEHTISGSNNRAKALIIEARPFVDDDTDDVIGNPKIEIKNLQNAQINDQLYVQYSTINRATVRMAHRMPSVVLGDADPSDSNDSTIREKLKIADQFVFAPIRRQVERFINEILFPAMGWANYVIRFNSPNTTDPKVIGDLMVQSEKVGGMTPRNAFAMMEEIWGKKLAPPSTVDFDMDVPMTLQIMRAQLKSTEQDREGGSTPKDGNQADPSEPGQQVMAETAKK